MLSFNGFLKDLVAERRSRIDWAVDFRFAFGFRSAAHGVGSQNAGLVARSDRPAVSDISVLSDLHGLSVLSGHDQECRHEHSIASADISLCRNYNRKAG